MWFRWMTRQNHILHNPASELELPRLGRALPKNIFSARRSSGSCSCATSRTHRLARPGDPGGAVLDRHPPLEVIALKLYDLSLDRGLILVRQGKGKKDRYVPIGERAIAWLAEVRPRRPSAACRRAGRYDRLPHGPGRAVQPRSSDLSPSKSAVDAAKLGKTGSCHLFRHTMATLMHENGADIRFIQQMLGHEDIKTTQIYTQVAIRALQQIHSCLHTTRLPEFQRRRALVPVFMHQ
jgi:integrase/recombinase XerD